MSYGDLAVRIINAYGVNPEGLNDGVVSGFKLGECDLDPFQLDVIQDVLDRGSGGVVTSDEVSYMNMADIPSELTSVLLKEDGKLALKYRARRLAERARDDSMEVTERMMALSELCDMDGDAMVAIPALFEIMSEDSPLYQIQTVTQVTGNAPSILERINEISAVTVFTKGCHITAKPPSESAVSVRLRPEPEDKGVQCDLSSYYRLMDPIRIIGDRELNRAMLPFEVQTVDIRPYLRIAAAMTLSNILGPNRVAEFSKLYKTI